MLATEGGSSKSRVTEKADERSAERYLWIRFWWYVYGSEFVPARGSEPLSVTNGLLLQTRVSDYTVRSEFLNVERVSLPHVAFMALR